MANSVAISQLVDLGAAPATGDLFVVVDVSDTSSSPNGTTKKLTTTELFTSPTISAPTLTGTTTASGITATGLVSMSNASGPTAVLTVNNNSGAASNNTIQTWRRGAVDKNYWVYESSDNLQLWVGNGTHAMQWDQGTGLTRVLAALNVTGDATMATGGVVFSTAAKGLTFKTGSNGRVGTGTLTAGTVTIANTSVTSNSYIMLTPTTSGGTPGVLRVSAISNGVSFTVTSSNVADASAFNYLIFETA